MFFFPLCFDFIELKGEKRNYPKINKFSNQTAKADMHVGTFIKLVPCTSCCQCHMVNLSLTFGIRKFGNVDRKGLDIHYPMSMAISKQNDHER